MYKIRPEQSEALRQEITASLPDRMLADYQQQGIAAERDPENGDLILADKRGKKSRLRFTPAGLPLDWTSPSGAVSRFEHDPRGRLSAVNLPEGQRAEVAYDSEGRPIELRRPGWYSYRFSYDDRSRITAVHYPDGSSQRYAWDRHSNLTRFTNRNNATTEYVRDEEGRLVAMVDPLKRQTTFHYAEGGLAAVGFADGTYEQYAAHSDLGAATVTLRDGTEVVHLLTPEGNLAGAVWPDSLVALDSDASGGLAVMTETSSVEMALDGNGNVTSEKCGGEEAEFACDPDGRPVSLATPAGKIEYLYNDDGYLAGIVEWGGRLNKIESGPGGEIRRIEYANGMDERRVPAKLGIFDQAIVRNPQLQPVSEQKYRWDNCERLAAWEDLSPSVRRRGTALFYDAEGHLREEHDPVTDRLLGRYEYDASGNMVNDRGTSVAYGALDQPVRYGTDPISYDALGQMTSLPGAQGGIACQFGTDGTLRRTACAGHVMAYEYDALGRRVGKTDGKARWRYGWAGVQLLWEEYQKSPDEKPVRRDYLFFPDGVLPFAFRENGRVYYMQTDVRGAVIRVFDDKGAIVWHAVYDSFGNAEILVERVRQPLRLAGQYYDEETGLHYNGTRYYSPFIKSYLSRDPKWADPEATKYSYAKNDPWNRIDPHGTIAPLVVVGLLAAGAAIGAAVGYGVAKVMGTDPVAGAIGGAVGGLGTFFGPVAGAVSGFAGGVVESLVRQYRAGGPICVTCALAEGAAGAIAGALLTGALSLVGRALKPVAGPLLRRLGSAIGSKAAAAKNAIVNWARTKAGPVIGRAMGRLKDAAKARGAQIKKWAQQQLKRLGGRTPYPGRRPPPPGARKTPALPTDDMINGSRKASTGIPKGHKDPNGIWDQNQLAKKPDLKSKLDDFEAGKAGKSAKDFDPAGKTPEQIHDELVDKGFSHQREPLAAGTDKATGNKLYKKYDGTKTTNPNDPDVVPHDIYTHKDGSMVRVKPEGDPGSPMRPEPHVSKSVLHDPAKGTGFDNEAFKVTNDGHAVPKSPSKDAGMRQAPPGSTGSGENQGYVDTVMTRAHTNLQ